LSEPFFDENQSVTSIGEDYFKPSEGPSKGKLLPSGNPLNLAGLAADKEGMDKQKLVLYAVIALASVFVARYLASGVFAWFDGYFFKRHRKQDPSLDELIDEEYLKLSGGRRRVSGQAVAPRIKSVAAPELEAPEDPAAEARKALLKRIYDFSYKRMTDESEEKFYLRVMDMKSRETPEILKRAYKLRSKEFHPDRFNLDGFDAKTKKRLEARVHENYLLVQAAYQFLKR